MSLETTICGIKLNSCIMNASGCWCTTEKELDDLYYSNAGAIVSKSGTMCPRNGNPKPRFFMDGVGVTSINSMGLPNLGYEFYLAYGKKITMKPFIQSVHPFSLDELDTMLARIEIASTKRNLVEINITCPNIMNGSNTNTFENFEKYMDRINQNTSEKNICGLKLSPLFEPDHFDIMSRLLLKYNIGFITCVNSIPNGLIIDPRTETTQIYPKSGLGGIGGTYCKPTALSNVYNFSQRLADKIDIIGCGGICSGPDAFEHILCGAKAVQLGTYLVNKSPGCFNNIENELKYLMESKKYSSINDFRGKIKVVDPEIN